MCGGNNPSKFNNRRSSAEKAVPLLYRASRNKVDPDNMVGDMIWMEDY
jgi:hypothetical protein